jgi:hypothetical protein
MPESSEYETAPTGEEIRDDAALRLLRPELLAMNPREVIREHKVRPSVAVALAEAASEKMKEHRETLVAECGPRAAALADRLLVVARATHQADIEVQRTALPTDLGPLAESVRSFYKKLWAELSALVELGIVEAEELEGARAIKGYDALSRSVLVMVSFLREHWDALARSTRLERAQVEAAATAAEALRRAVTLRKHRAVRRPAVELLARALTTLVREYEEARRKLTYVRWYEGDADEIAPSLYARARKSKPEKVIEDASPVEEEAVTPGPTDGGPFVE